MGVLGLSGVHAAGTKHTGLVMIALRMALWQRDREGVGGGIQPSIGSVGDAYDNALIECVIGLFKVECVRTRQLRPAVPRP
jgi:hypothetical protein